MGFLNIELFKWVIRGRARNGRNLRDFLGEKDDGEGIIEAARRNRNSPRRLRYPGDADITPYSKVGESQESSEYKK